jgi:hypothetical protein
MKNTISIPRPRAVALALALAAVACEGVQDDAPAEPPATKTTAHLVHTIDQGNGHLLEFYDLGDGLVGVKEELDKGDRPLLDKLPDGNHTLADLYRRVRPGQAIPAAIVDADVRAAADVARLKARYAASPTLLDPAPPSAPGSELAQIQQAATSCSSDLFGDRWGEQWFLANFGWSLEDNLRCTHGFTQWKHLLNVGSAHASRAGGSWWQYKQFEGDFNVAGKAKIYRSGFPYPTFVVSWQGDVKPRKVLWWNISGGVSWQTNHASGSSPCGHLMNAVMWCGFP